MWDCGCGVHLRLLWREDLRDEPDAALLLPPTSEEPGEHPTLADEMALNAVKTTTAGARGPAAAAAAAAGSAAGGGDMWRVLAEERLAATLRQEEEAELITEDVLFMMVM